MFDKLCEWDHLLNAYLRAASGKRGRAAAARFEYRLEENLLDLQSDLIEGRYQPGQYASFHVHEPKRRLISAAPFRDRVVHHALCMLIEPLFERGFIFDSYANRVGKGSHRALDRCQQFARQYTYCLKLDVVQFFPAIDHQVLRRLLAKRIRDERILGLIDRILASGVGVLSDEYRMAYFGDDDLFAANRERGLPIGNLTSQFWANCYLDPLDHFIKRRLRCDAYIRYVDDMLLFHNDRNALHAMQAAIVERLERLRLTVHEAAQPRPVTDGISFLGFRVFSQQRRLIRRKGIHFQRKYRSMCIRYRHGELPQEAMTISVQGWINHVRYANTIGLRKAMFRAPITRSYR